ncbi:MMPL family transporter [Deinococcus radiophilus]|uniref:MMPL family transporter n=1 Tax=Deinococcus radiophilus TaxID=32062 RepID=UPI00361323E7
MTASIGELPNAESTQVTALLRSEFGEQQLNTALLVVQPQAGQPAGARATALGEFREGLEDVPGVLSVQSASELGGLHPAGDGPELVAAQIPLYEGATEALRAVRRFAQTFEEERGLEIGVTGLQAIADDFTHYAESDTRRSELTAMPLIALVLLLVFGALVATGLPMVVGVVSITLTLATLYLLASWLNISTFTQSVVTMLGLGAGIDYALLMVSRFREELSRDLDSVQAAHTTMLTAGRSVTWSGATVAIAMAGLTVPPLAYVQSIGIGGVLAVGMTVLTSLTVLPALLTLLGERVNSPRRWAVRSGRLAELSPRWHAWAHRVMRRPWAWTLAGTALLALLAAPTLGMQTGYGGAWACLPALKAVTRWTMCAGWARVGCSRSSR